MSTPLTSGERAVLLGLIDAVMELVNAAGPMGRPSGELYSYLMPLGITIQQYQQILDSLVAVGYITVSNHLIKSTGLCKSVRP